MTDAVITSKPIEFIESKLLVGVSELNKIFLKTNDKLEIVHFIGGG